MDRIHRHRSGLVAYFFVIVAAMFFSPTSKVYGIQRNEFVVHTNQTNILAKDQTSLSPNFYIVDLDSSSSGSSQNLSENNKISESSTYSSNDSFAQLDGQRKADTFFQGNVIGWLFFGQSYDGFGVIDIFFIAVVLVVIMKLTKHVNSNGYPSAESSSKNTQKYDVDRKKDNGYIDGSPFKKPTQPIGAEGDLEKAEIKKRASSAWDALRSSPTRQREEGHELVMENRGKVHQGFDERSFLEGAKVFYSRLQYSWAARDLDDLVPFTTKEMMETLKEQAVHDPEPSSIEVLLVNAVLAGVTQDDKQEKAKVLFSALIQEEKDEAPFDVKELWHFTHGFDNDINWRLDAIEPVN